MPASSFYLATSVAGATLGYTMILVGSGAGGIPGGGPTVPTTGQIWPRGNW